MTAKIIAFLESWRDLTRAIEAVMVDNLAATTPWLTPIIPAYLVWRSLIYKLDFSPGIALISAAIVEFLGLAAVHTTFSLWDYNDTRRKSDQRAPVFVAAAASLFYLAVVLVVNLVLDGDDWREMLALFLLSTLTAVAAVILAIRAQHARRLAEIERDKAERSERRKRKPVEIPQPPVETPAEPAEPTATAAYYCVCGWNSAEAEREGKNAQRAYAGHKRSCDIEVVEREAHK